MSPLGVHRRAASSRPSAHPERESRWERMLWDPASARGARHEPRSLDLRPREQTAPNGEPRGGPRATKPNPNAGDPPAETDDRTAEVDRIPRTPRLRRGSATRRAEPLFFLFARRRSFLRRRWRPESPGADAASLAAAAMVSSCFEKEVAGTPTAEILDGNSSLASSFSDAEIEPTTRPPVRMMFGQAVRALSAEETS